MTAKPLRRPLGIGVLVAGTLLATLPHETAAIAKAPSKTKLRAALLSKREAQGYDRQSFHGFARETYCGRDRHIADQRALGASFSSPTYIGGFDETLIAYTNKRWAGRAYRELHRASRACHTYSFTNGGGTAFTAHVHAARSPHFSSASFAVRTEADAAGPYYCFEVIARHGSVILDGSECSYDVKPARGQAVGFVREAYAKAAKML